MIFNAFVLVFASHPLRLDAGQPQPGPRYSLVPSKFSLIPHRRQKLPMTYHKYATVYKLG